MASQSGRVAPAIPATASLVGNAFVNQYYNVLHQSPHVVHRFYTDESKLSRAEAGPNGTVDTVVTQAGIHEKVMSMDYGDIRAEIKTVDSQESLSGSVLVMVSGSLSSQSRAKRNFVQTFFLAPQEKGYYVLNDMFRYLDGEQESLRPLASMGNGTLDPNSTPDVPSQVGVDSQLPPQLEVRDYSSPAFERAVSLEEPYQHPEEEEAPEIEEPTAEEVISSHPEVVTVAASEEQLPPANFEEANPEEAPKKSYASILRVRSEASGTSVATSQTAVHKTAPAQVEHITSSPQVYQVAPPSAGLSSDEVDEGTGIDAEGDGRSVYVKNLPPNITTSELEKEFQKFGLISPGGVNLRNQKVGVCFAFIEYEESRSVQNAIEVSPISIGGRQVYVEEKRPMPLSARGGRGRYNLGRGYQGDGMRGRGYYGGRDSGRGSGQDSERDFNMRGRGAASGRGSYGAGNAYASNNYGSTFNTVNGYRRAESQGVTGPRPARRGAGNQMGRGSGPVTE